MTQQIQPSSWGSYQQPNWYKCPSCGQWVYSGSFHQCLQWWPNVLGETCLPQVRKFKGFVAKFKDLPKTGVQVGDAYVVRDLEILVVRVANGWHHFDS